MNVPLILQDVNLSPTLLENRREYIQTVRDGIPGTIVKKAIAILGERELFVRLLNTTSGNLHRLYRSSSLSKAHTEGILDTLKVFALAVNVFGEEDLAKEWLHSSLPVLGGEAPINLCDTFEGRKLVRESLTAIEYGEFV